MKSRRQFLKLVAVGSAATLSGGARSAAAAAAVAAKAAAPAAGVSTAPRSAAVVKEIDRQKKNTTDALKVIRKYELPAGSPLAFTFKPLRPGKGGR